jgi:signal transduction histidine kinase
MSEARIIDTLNVALTWSIAVIFAVAMVLIWRRDSYSRCAFAILTFAHASWAFTILANGLGTNPLILVFLSQANNALFVVGGWFLAPRQRKYAPVLAVSIFLYAVVFAVAAVGGVESGGWGSWLPDGLASGWTMVVYAETLARQFHRMHRVAWIWWLRVTASFGAVLQLVPPEIEGSSLPDQVDALSVVVKLAFLCSTLALAWFWVGDLEHRNSRSWTGLVAALDSRPHDTLLAGVVRALRDAIGPTAAYQRQLDGTFAVAVAAPERAHQEILERHVAREDLSANTVVRAVPAPANEEKLEVVSVPLRSLAGNDPAGQLLVLRLGGRPLGEAERRILNGFAAVASRVVVRDLQLAALRALAEGAAGARTLDDLRNHTLDVLNRLFGPHAAVQAWALGERDWVVLEGTGAAGAPPRWAREPGAHIGLIDGIVQRVGYALTCSGTPARRVAMLLIGAEGDEEARDAADVEWSAFLTAAYPILERAAERLRQEHSHGEIVQRFEELQNRSAQVRTILRMRHQAHVVNNLVQKQLLPALEAEDATSNPRELRRALRRAGDDISTASREILEHRDSAPELIDVRRLLHDLGSSLRVLADRQGAHLVIRASDAPAWTKGVRRELEFVIDTLATNALEAVDRGTVCLTLNRSNAHWSIAVKDDGPGVPPDVACQLFHRPVLTRKLSGTGNALHLSHMTVSRHGGSLSLVPSTVGAHFVLNLLAA